MILADTVAIWSQITAPNIKPIIETGTDEHGIKIYKSSAQANMNLDVFCEQNSTAFIVNLH